MARTFIDIHVLQTVPPSNLNRDDSGSPKTAVFGGVRRSRVSSQAWKRATRKRFEEILDPSEVGVRSRMIVDLVAEHIAEQAPDLSDKAEELAAAVIGATGIKIEKDKKKDAEDSSARQLSSYLVFMSRNQARALAKLAVLAEREGRKPSKKEAGAAFDQEHSIDLALFGRMVADAPELNVDAAAQVAHAIGVHGVATEFDYFTAVDDRAPEDNAGAGMIGTVEFNSSTLYRYATVNAELLAESLGSPEAAGKAVEAFVRAFADSMPTGKQNTFANRTLPDAVVVEIRDNQPVNLVGAFEQPIATPSDGGSRVARAVSALVQEHQNVAGAYGDHTVSAQVVYVKDALSALEQLGERGTLEDVARRVGELVSTRVGA